MKKMFLSIMLLCANHLAANDTIALSDEFVAYHLKVAVDQIEDKDIFDLLQVNIDNLKNREASDHSANELINLINEGYKIDPFSMSKLIDTLTYKDASNNAARVIIAAIEHGSKITRDHLYSLIETIGNADASNNATTVILTAIEHGTSFSTKDMIHLAKVSLMSNAKKNIEKIRSALHKKEKQ
jgi:hypothetical protein